MWLDDENSGQEVLIDHLTVSQMLLYFFKLSFDQIIHVLVFLYLFGVKII